MTALTWAVLVAAAVATVGITVVTLWVVVRRVRAAVAQATAAFDELRPAIARLQQDTAVTQREFERVSGALDELARQRDSRRTRR